MKNNLRKKGFTLAEVIVVASIVLIALVGIYISYNKIFSVYYTMKTYSNVDTLYRVGEIRDNLIDNNIINDINITSDNPIKIISSDYLKANEIAYYVYIDNNKINSLTVDIFDKENINQTFRDYIKYLSTSTTFKSEYIIVLESTDTNKKCSYAYLEIYKEDINIHENHIPSSILINNYKGSKNKNSNYTHADLYHPNWIDSKRTPAYDLGIGHDGTEKQNNLIIAIQFNVKKGDVVSNINLDMKWDKNQLWSILFYEISDTIGDLDVLGNTSISVATNQISKAKELINDKYNKGMNVGYIDGSCDNDIFCSVYKKGTVGYEYINVSFSIKLNNKLEAIDGDKTYYIYLYYLYDYNYNTMSSNFNISYS